MAAEVDLLGGAEVADPEVAGLAGAIRCQEGRLGIADLAGDPLHLDRVR